MEVLGVPLCQPLRQIHYTRIVRSGTRRILPTQNISVRATLLDDEALYYLVVTPQQPILQELSAYILTR